MLGIVKKVMEGYASSDIKRLKKQVEQINQQEDGISRLTDVELQKKTNGFKELLSKGSSLEDIKIEAFAVVREAAKRVLGQRHYDVQLLGGLVLHEGSIAEMQTGEGKTLVASLPSYLNALTGKGVHVITVNEYLAKRDYETIGRIHRFLGLQVGLNSAQFSKEEKQTAYQADITYGTGTEFGFDYLRDHMVLDSDEKVQRSLQYAIIDEIDSILIDEVRTPLIIANKSQLSGELYYITNQIVSAFKLNEHYECEQETRQLYLSDKGILVVEQSFGINNLFSEEHQLLYHFILQSLRAHVFMKRDVDYMIKDGEVLLVDSFTGRVMEGRSYSDGLQSAIEAKEGLQIKDENETQATITVQNYFKTYEKLSGLTGTASTEKQEFFHTYQLNVVEIPTNRPRQRVDLPDIVYRTLEEKYRRIVSEIRENHRKDRPVLVGTTSIEQSEYLSRLLDQENLPYLLLNAKSEEQEAQIISIAGQQGTVTIATNMAGRGTDILLGDGVSSIGGLHIIGTERHENRRIDHQLRGRAGRQGDPGSSQFILSLEDELFQKVDPEETKKWLKKCKVNDAEEIVSPNPIQFINKTQQSVEGLLFSAREHLLKIDNVIVQQQKIVYSLRNRILDESVMPILMDSLTSYTNHVVDTHCADELEEEWNLNAMHASMQTIFPEQVLALSQFQDQSKFQLKKKVQKCVDTRKNLLRNHGSDDLEIGQEMKGFMLRSLDGLWLDQLEKINFIKEGMHLHSYSQEDPYRIFEKETYQIFIEMLETWDRDIVLQFSAIIQYRSKNWGGQ